MKNNGIKKVMNLFCKENNKEKEKTGKEYDLIKNNLIEKISDPNILNKMADDIFSFQISKELILASVNKLNTSITHFEHTDLFTDKIYYSVDMLKLAVKENLIDASVWASIAIYYNVFCLTTATDKTSTILNECAVILQNIIQEYIKYNATEKMLDLSKRKYEIYYKNKKEIEEELEKQKNTTNYEDTIEAIKRNKEELAPLSGETQTLKELLEKYDLYSKCCDEKYNEIMAKQSELKMFDNIITPLIDSLIKFDSYMDNYLCIKIESVIEEKIKELQSDLEQIDNWRKKHNEYLQNLEKLKPYIDNTKKD